VRGPDNATLHKWWNGRTDWQSSWETLGGKPNGGQSADAKGYVYIRGFDDAIYWKSFDGGLDQMVRHRPVTAEAAGTDRVRPHQANQDSNAGGPSGYQFRILQITYTTTAFGWKPQLGSPAHVQSRRFAEDQAAWRAGVVAVELQPWQSV
jgi:hypothetical protein